MKILEFYLEPIERWPYEQAFCTDFVLVFDNDDEWNGIHTAWTKQFGHSIADNKVTFKCTNCNENFTPIYVTFYDGKVYIGLGVRPYRGSKLEKPESVKV